MTPIRIIVCGFGNVGRAFVRLIEDKQGDLKSRYGIAPQIEAIVDIGGAAVAGAHAHIYPTPNSPTTGKAKNL